MKPMYFRCQLLSDIVLNSNAATQGNQKSLDFIPGNNFLGIAASELYDNNDLNLSSDDYWQLFHSGKVRFGDAHLEKDNYRSLKIPALMYHEKSKDIKDGLYILHKVTDSDLKNRLKQCREGFYTFNERDSNMNEVKANKKFMIKSAYDRKKRRSADEEMYGYESLEAGNCYLFEVNIDDDIFEKYEKIIKAALEGSKRIGRSRTAQYGLAEIQEIEAYSDCEKLKIENDSVLIYADARLIFLDEYGLPTFQPKAKDFGFKEGEIEWSKSQIRTFQYAPWNSKRHVRDSDRCGIEKGSVIYIKNTENAKEINVLENHFVGFYQNEGFGKVIFNPEFLNSKKDGQTTYSVIPKENSEKNKKGLEKLDVLEKDSSLIKYLKIQNNKILNERNIYKIVNDFVEKNKKTFLKENFSSQWGSIRNLAMQHKTKSELEEKLFGEETGYLMHGIAKDKWAEGRRKQIFKNFFDSFDDESASFAVINLAAEMAKNSKGEN